MSTTARIVEAEQADLAGIADAIGALRRDLSVLTERVKPTGVNTAGEATAALTGQAERLYGKLASQGNKTAKAIGRKVDEQPLTALLIAFGIGLISGRLLSD
jgi:ElaB/YqjD/DUF883 family membrane-anchored ribosome-binding protein